MIAAHPDRPSGEIGHAGAGEAGGHHKYALGGDPFRPDAVQPAASAGYHGGMRRTYLRRDGHHEGGQEMSQQQRGDRWKALTLWGWVLVAVPLVSLLILARITADNNALP